MRIGGYEHEIIIQNVVIGTRNGNFRPPFNTIEAQSIRRRDRCFLIQVFQPSSNFPVIEMNILVYSDLHLELSDFNVNVSGFDVVVLAGDIHRGDKGVRWAKRMFPAAPVIYLCGNHEYYFGEVHDVHHSIEKQAEGSNVVFCENRTVEFGNVRFVCATLWTDFDIDDDREFSMKMGPSTMNDYRRIQYGEQTLLPDDTEKFHWNSRRYIESECIDSTPGAGKTVVVTHHAPSLKSFKCERVYPDLFAYYGSSLDDMIVRSGVDLWIHGHTHESADYQIGDTRVFSNPRGYSTTANGHGNPNFRSDCIISV